MADLLTQIPISFSDKVGLLRSELKEARSRLNWAAVRGKITYDERDRRIRIMELIVADYEQGRVAP
jgi:hypothetical protein